MTNNTIVAPVTEPPGITGIGVVSVHGRGLECCREAMARGTPPVPTTITWRDHAYRALPVPAAALIDPGLLGPVRRADRFCKMAVIAAHDALTDAALPPEERPHTGIILGTAFGPHPTMFSFLDGLIDYGEKAVSPTAFSHSVHGAAASSIAMTLGITGPLLTLTRFPHAFTDAWQLAHAWLAEGRCRHLLVLAVDELGDLMLHAAQRLYPEAAAVGITEGAVAFLLSSTLSARYPHPAALPPANRATACFGHFPTHTAFPLLLELLNSPGPSPSASGLLSLDRTAMGAVG